LKEDTKSKLWPRKFNRKWIDKEDQLLNTIEYVCRNHEKHETSWGKDFLCGYLAEFKMIVESCCKSVDELTKS